MSSTMPAPQKLDKDPKRGTLLVTAIEQKAYWLPNETYMRYPAQNWEVDGYRSLTWSQFASSIDKVAHWLDSQLGKATEIVPVAYLGPNDLRYAILWPAMIKTGRKLMMPDGRVTDEGLKALIEATKCKIWIYAEDDVNGPPASLPAGMEKIALPDVNWFLDAAGHAHYSYEKTWDEAKWDETLIIHTSGTTGNPKPIFLTNGWHACAKFRVLSSIHWPRGTMFDAWMGKATLAPCPPQWLGGIKHYVHFPVYMDTIAIIPPPDQTSCPPEVFKKILHFNIVDGIAGPPHNLMQLYAQPDTQQLLKNFQFVLYAGAAMDKKVGDDLADHTKMISIIGSTETGAQPSLMPLDKKLWNTQDFIPEAGSRMIRVEGTGAAADGSDDLYELVLYRAEDGDPTMFQPAFWNPKLKDLEKFETNELYAPVKDLDGRTRWVFAARKDDLTKLQWLAKFHAQDIEKIIQQHPDVSGVFVGGEGRPNPYVIIEPNDGDVEGESADVLLGKLYESWTQNSGTHTEISIPKETFILTKPGKPLKRSFKQTLMRKEIEKDYNAEIEEAYARLLKAKA